MLPVEDSSTHSGRTASGKNWTLQLFSPGLSFGDAEFTNSAGTTVQGFWRRSSTGICQSYNGRESWSCHDIFACEGESNRFVMRNSAGEFTSVVEASVGPSYELGATTSPETSSYSSSPFDFGVYATEERFCEIDEAEAVELGDAVGAVNRLIDESGWHRYESVCQPQSYTLNGDVVFMETLCSGEGSQWPSTMEVQRLSSTAFRDGGRTFRLCSTAQEQQAALEVSSARSDPRAQRQLDVVSPSCRGIDVLGDFFCKEINIREVMLDSNLQETTKQEVLSDGRITLDEYHYAWHRDVMTPWGFKPHTRRMWLLMNGYDPDMDGNSWFPEGTMTVAVASRRDTPLPEVTPACDVTPEPSSCSKIGVGLLQGEDDFPGVALYQYIVWRDIPVFDQWLADNGLTGSGVTLFSLVDAGWYTTKSCSACR